MVRNFRGQVRITDVQAEFDALIAKINADIEEYNKVINENENIDFTHGSPSLSGSGYCLTVGGLKKLLAAYNGTMMGAKPFRNSAGDTLVTAGVLVQSTGCSPTTGAIVDNTGRHLYYNPTNKTFTISDDGDTGGGGGGQLLSGIPAQDSNTGIYYTASTNEGNSTDAYKIIDTPDIQNREFNTTLSKRYHSTNIGYNGHCTLFFNNTEQFYIESSTYYKPASLTFEIKEYSQLTALQDAGDTNPKICVALLYSDDPGQSSFRVLKEYKIPFSELFDPDTLQDGIYYTRLGTNGIRLTFDMPYLINTEETNNYLSAIKVDWGYECDENTNPETALDIAISRLVIQDAHYQSGAAPSGVCDMNPNRTYPYLKTIHNTELYNLRTNKIITESRNLTNGSKKSCSKIANDTWTADDNKNESIFVSYNARHSNDGQPNPPVYLNIEGLRSNFNIGTKFTHGSSTSACYRFPKFFFLPKGCRNPFSTTDINTDRIRYNKYKCNITQKK